MISITLLSKYNTKFVIPLENAIKSKTLEYLIEDVDIDNSTTIRLPIDDNILSIIVQNMEKLEPDKTDEKYRLDTLIASNYLDFQELLIPLTKIVFESLKEYDEMSLLKFGKNKKYETVDILELFRLKMRYEYQNKNISKDICRLLKSHYTYIYGFGLNDCGQLGFKSYKKSVLIPCKLSYYPITSLVCGNYSSAFISNGELYTFGLNYGRKLGHSFFNEIYTPKKVNLKNVSYVALKSTKTLVTANGKLHIYENGKERYINGWTSNANINVIIATNDKNFEAVLVDNKLYTSGNNRFGQLGHGDINYRKNLTQIKGFDNIQKVACSYDHMLFISDNKLYACGKNYAGQLCLGHTNNVNIPTLVPNFTNVTHVATDDLHTAFIDSGKLYTCGDGGYGKLGHGLKNGTNIPTLVEFFKNVVVKDVAVGYEHTLVLAE